MIGKIAHVSTAGHWLFWHVKGLKLQTKPPPNSTESRDARRTALPRNLFTDTLRPDLRRWNDSGVPQVGTAGPASEFALKKETVRLNAPEEEHVAPLEGIPTVTLLEGLIRQETL